MMLRVSGWFLARSTRERRLIVLMSIIALPLLAWLLVVQPLSRAHDEALIRHIEAIDRNGRIKALAAAMRGGARATPRLQGDLSLVVAEAAARAGLTLATNSGAGPNSVTVTIAQAPPTPVMQWLHDFELQGIEIAELRMIPVGENSVSLSVRLARTPE